MSTLDLEITTMAHGGSGIGRIDGRVVFCPGVIPGETVEVELVETSKKSLWRAQPISVVTPSPHRVDHIWPEADMSRPYATRAGGADYGHIALAHQRELKTAILRDALTRFGKLPDSVANTVSVNAVDDDDERNGLHWRTRVSLHALPTGQLGPYAAKSHTIIPVTSLPLASQAIVDSGVLSEEYEGVTNLRVLDTTGSGVRLIIDDQKPGDIVEKVGDTEFALSDHSFWQVHHQAPAVLTSTISRAVQREFFDPGANNLDLYSGVGLLGHALASLAPGVTRLTAVESDDLAINYVSRNLHGVADVDPVAARVDKWLSTAVATRTAGDSAAWKKATVILDPPRSGAKAEVISSLTALNVAQIVYVACDPVALGRDTALLAEAGYEPVFFEAWDLFPHTHHMETIATFVKTSVS